MYKYDTRRVPIRLGRGAFMGRLTIWDELIRVDVEWVARLWLGRKGLEHTDRRVVIRRPRLAMGSVLLLRQNTATVAVRLLPFVWRDVERTLKNAGYEITEEETWFVGRG